MIQNLETAAPGNDISSKRTKKFDEIILLKGLAIIGVVVCHVAATFNGEGWSSVIKGDYDPFLAFLYAYFAAFFRIFFVISGYLYATSPLQKLSMKEYGRYIFRKFQRLLVPFLFLTTINIILSAIFGEYAGVPTEVNLGHLWYLIVLFIIFLLFPLVEKILNRIKSFVVMCAIVCMMLSLYYFIGLIPMGDSIFNSWFFYSLLILQYGGFFYFGYFCQKRQIFEKIKASSNYNKILGILLPILIVLIIINQFINPTNIIEVNPSTFNPLSIISISLFTVIYAMVNACFYWVLALKLVAMGLNLTILKSLGNHSYSIYLLHIPLIFILIYYNLDIFLHNPYILSLLFSGLGIFIPFLFSKFIIKKNRVISYLFGETNNS